MPLARRRIDSTRSNQYLPPGRFFLEEGNIRRVSQQLLHVHCCTSFGIPYIVLAICNTARRPMKDHGHIKSTTQVTLTAAAAAIIVDLEDNDGTKEKARETIVVPYYSYL